MSRHAKQQISRHLPAVSTSLATPGMEQGQTNASLNIEQADVLSQTLSRWLDLSLLAAVCILFLYQNVGSLQIALSKSITALMEPATLIKTPELSPPNFAQTRPMVEPVHAVKMARTAEVLRQIFSNDVELIVEKDAITLRLVDDFFAKREYQLEARKQELLRRVFSAAYATNENFMIKIVGHSDDVPVLHRSKRISSNQDLALMRAKSAADLAINLGFAPRNVFYSGDTERARNTRSLSIHLHFSAS